MATPTREAVETFMSVTGASESIAVRKLQEHGGNLNEAVNAHFAEGFYHIPNPTHANISGEYFMQANNQTPIRHRGLLPLLSAVRSFKPSSLLDPTYRRNLYDQIGVSAFSNPSSVAYPSQYASGSEQPYYLGLGHTSPDPRGMGLYTGIPVEQSSMHSYRNHSEEEMLQAAIEASKRDFRVASGRLHQEQNNLGDDDLDHAISLSLMTAETEKAEHEQELNHDLQINMSSEKTDETNTSEEFHGKLVAGALLPPEPALDDTDAIAIIVCMPDGSRHGRRFLMSDKLQSLYDFINAGGWAKPGSYRLIRPYPREVFSSEDMYRSFMESGLTGKQEALFLELI